MLNTALPYYQAELGNRLCYELTFNDYNQVINSTVAAPDAKYKITDISLEYEIVSQPTLAKHISDEYQSTALLYDRVLRHRQIRVNKSDTTWNWSFNMPCKTHLALDLLESEYKNHFDFIIIIFPTLKHNETYRSQK